MITVHTMKMTEVMASKIKILTAIFTPHARHKVLPKETKAIQPTTTEKDLTIALHSLEERYALENRPKSLSNISLRISQLFIRLLQFSEAEKIIEAALLKNPTHRPVLKAYAEIALLKRTWPVAAERWERLFEAAKKAPLSLPLQIEALCGHLTSLKAGGRSSEAPDYIKEHYSLHPGAWAKNCPSGYGKFIIFNNGITRIEYYIKIYNASSGKISSAPQLVTTFDDRRLTWKQEPFALKALRQRDIDVLAVRKRRKGDCHQDLDRRDFIEIAGGISSAYEDHVALGPSLGAYCALYYATHLPSCRVLVTSPRNSLNPKYGPKKYAELLEFRHEYDMPVVTDCRPTIVYDPKDKRDRKYIRASISASFPNATFIHYPYCGHCLPRYLRDAGILKSAVLGFCAGQGFPAFDRTLRGRSSEYFRNLARLNLAAGRLGWARRLTEKAVQLGTNIKHSNALLAKIDSLNASDPKTSKIKNKAPMRVFEAA